MRREREWKSECGSGEKGVGVSVSGEKGVGE